MFKWTNNVIVLAIDADTVYEDFLSYSYKDGVIKFLFSKNKNNKQYYYFYDIKIMLEEICNKYDVKTNNIVCISDDYLLLGDLMLYHIGTIKVSPKNIEKYIGTLPDHFCVAPSEIDMIINNQFEGYYAEKLAALKSMTSYYYHFMHNEKENITVYFAGRYYPKSRSAYYSNDVLSESILEFKNRRVTFIDHYFEAMVTVLKRNMNIDIVTYVPPKPNDTKRDRFGEMVFYSINDIKLSNEIRCVKNYNQKFSSAEERRENVKDAYEVIDQNRINGKDILVLDDIYTTGSTIEEIYRVLKNKGARTVSFLVIAVNQRLENIRYNYSMPLYCKCCNSELILRLRKDDSSWFYGCNNYYENDGCKKSSVNYQNGNNAIMEHNSIEFTEDNEDYKF